MIEINKKLLKIKPDFYTKSTIKKNKIILTDTLRSTLEYSNGYYGTKEKYPNFIIDKDGQIYEYFSSLNYSDFYEERKINQQSIIVALVNANYLIYRNSVNAYNNWCYDDIKIENVKEFPWKNYRYWETYTDEQFKSVINLIKHLNQTQNIELNSTFDNIYDQALIKDYHGILSESNLFNWSNSLNPSFNFSEMRIKLS